MEIFEKNKKSQNKKTTLTRKEFIKKFSIGSLIGTTLMILYKEISKNKSGKNKTDQYEKFVKKVEEIKKFENQIKESLIEDQKNHRKIEELVKKIENLNNPNKQKEYLENLLDYLKELDLMDKKLKYWADQLNNITQNLIEFMELKDVQKNIPRYLHNSIYNLIKSLLKTQKEILRLVKINLNLKERIINLINLIEGKQKNIEKILI
ncbi:MAG: hypothetical protein NZM02_01805 [Patescibacteria group bacterium]|nr:hypothetical protein [Patescibacteria group bacterium]